MSRPDDPRDEAERARAALKRNAEMDFAAIPAGPTDETPSVTPATFGERSGFKDDPARPPPPEEPGEGGPAG